MEPLDVAVRLLEAAPGEFYCAICLGDAVAVPRLTAQRLIALLETQPDFGLIARLETRPDFHRLSERCAGCGVVTTTAVGYVPIVTCVRCSRPIRRGQPFIVDDDDPFHRHCWHILQSNARIADARQATRLSWELIRRSQRRGGWPPLDD